jgi:hypothetical protein
MPVKRRERTGGARAYCAVLGRGTKAFRRTCSLPITAVQHIGRLLKTQAILDFGVEKGELNAVFVQLAGFGARAGL